LAEITCKLAKTEFRSDITHRVSTALDPAADVPSAFKLDRISRDQALAAFELGRTLELATSAFWRQVPAPLDMLAEHLYAQVGLRGNDEVDVNGLAHTGHDDSQLYPQ
jgi:hypothetical protein